MDYDAILWGVLTAAPICAVLLNLFTAGSRVDWT